MTSPTAKTVIVSNTGPLIALDILNLNYLLTELFETYIPDAVLQELLIGDFKYRNYKLSDIWINSAIILPTIAVDPLLSSMLDKGEAQVIQSAVENKITFILLDEYKARKIAFNVYGLQPIGTVGLLVLAKKKGLLTSIKPLVHQLRKEGYRISNSIQDWALKQCSEI